MYCVLSTVDCVFYTYSLCCVLFHSTDIIFAFATAGIGGSMAYGLGNARLIPVFGVFVSCWSILMLEYWKRSEHTKAMEWCVYGLLCFCFCFRFLFLILYLLLVTIVLISTSLICCYCLLVFLIHTVCVYLSLSLSLSLYFLFILYNCCLLCTGG